MKIGHRWILSVALIVYAIDAAEAANVDSSIRTVALTGQSAPGGGTFSGFDPFTAPVLNDAGHTAFFATAGCARSLVRGVGNAFAGRENRRPGTGYPRSDNFRF